MLAAVACAAEPAGEPSTTSPAPAPLVVHLGQPAVIALGTVVTVRNPHAVERGTAVDVDVAGAPLPLRWVIDLPGGRLVPALEGEGADAVTFPVALPDTEGAAVTAATGEGAAATWRLG